MSIRIGSTLNGYSIASRPHGQHKGDTPAEVPSLCYAPELPVYRKMVLASHLFGCIELRQSFPDVSSPDAA